jgi:hypothetical protein
MSYTKKQKLEHDHAQHLFTIPESLFKTDRHLFTLPESRLLRDQGQITIDLASNRKLFCELSVSATCKCDASTRLSLKNLVGSVRTQRNCHGCGLIPPIPYVVKMCDFIHETFVQVTVQRGPESLGFEWVSQFERRYTLSGDDSVYDVVVTNFEASRLFDFMCVYTTGRQTYITERLVHSFQSQEVRDVSMETGGGECTLVLKKPKPAGQREIHWLADDSNNILTLCFITAP